MIHTIRHRTPLNAETALKPGALKPPLGLGLRGDSVSMLTMMITGVACCF